MRSGKKNELEEAQSLGSSVVVDDEDEYETGL